MFILKTRQENTLIDPRLDDFGLFLKFSWKRNQEQFDKDAQSSFAYYI